MIFFVTGGSRGLGRAIVIAAAEAGHEVAFTWASDEAAAEETRALAGPDRCRAWRLDTRDPRQVDAVAEAVLDAYGTVDVVVPNAGITRDGMAATMTDEAWRDVIDTNLSGAFYVARAFIPTLMSQRCGRLVFISSVARNGIAGQANYSAAKAGLVGLAKALGKEYGPRGITANVVVPGFIETDMTRGSMSQKLKDFAEASGIGARIGQPAQLAAAVLFLASPAADYINCAVLPVTAGLDWAP
ncbi:MAG: SDR family oxidoreductase [bacterium]